MKIILLGANDRACYSLAKSFTKNGNTVHVINDESHAIKYSKFVASFFITNFSFQKETCQAVDEIIQLLKENKYDVLIPVHDVALTICSEYFDILSGITTILYINKPSIHQYCRDKSKLLELCKSLNLPVPESVLISNLSELENLSGINYPCIARPVSSRVFKNGKIFSYAAKKMNNENELIDFLREKVETVPVMVQKIITEGFGAGYNFLSKDGKVLSAYAHERIHEAWGGGQSTYRKTIDPDTYNLQNISLKIIEQTGWTGIAMLEYKIKDGVPYIMEMNGRTWGSIELGIFAGCRLPENMLDSLIKDKPVEPYYFSENYFARNIFNELIWILQSKSVPKIVQWFFSLKECFSENQLIEDTLLADFKFRFYYRTGIIFNQLKKAYDHLAQKVIPVPNKMITRKNELSGKKIVFICKGNINRSAFAAIYFNQKYPCFRAESFGTIFEEDRLSPVNALKAAANFGVDLGIHKSKYLSEKIASEKDVFIIMDKKNYFDLRQLQVPSEKIFHLRKKDIADPYDHNLDFFQIVFRDIADSIDSLFNEAVS